ncbi:hypothetical protein OH76DRAFT_1367526 [Lentinus brumalis]|uniref:CxC2-like cysteine cluster KDZ transposase-associated domain-containing protein n=1 Tax=Lentinus brumalis TaxID=2498619 RepID=A0A371CGN2_9APHY|nr:hypothetical protein OH76DRAFT_1367526 [Polyporus brumalis]
MCRCPSFLPWLDQLLLAQLFPASLNQPKSAFTFEVMSDAHLDTLTSKKSAYDYVRKLRRRTDNWCPHGVKRCGWCHGVRYPNSPEDDVIVFRCLACPWPGVNLPDKWAETEKRLMYIYTPRLGGDGNHSLQKKAKKDDPTDHSLAGTRAFFNDIRKLPGYTGRFPKEQGKIVETCSGFKVTRSQKVGKFRFLHITGVVAVTCTRHGCFWPRAVVDLPGGEQFLLMDLAMSGALECLKSLVQWMMTYDVACSYLKNILIRWKEGNLPADLRPVVEKLQVLLPQLHMLAHREWCQSEFAVCYTYGAGHTNGEAVEPIWGAHNAAGPSTREMNGGARHDALNDMFSFWNWMKHETMGKYLARKLQEKLLLQVDQLIDFAALTLAAGTERVQAWAARGMDRAAPTPLNCREREKTRPRDVFLLSSDAGACARCLNLSPAHALPHSAHHRERVQEARRRFCGQCVCARHRHAGQAEDAGFDA